MDEFHIAQWLANLLGPGGFVAACGLIASGYMNWKQFHYARRDQEKATLAMATLAKELNAKHDESMVSLQKECRIERDDWANRLQTSDEERKARALQARQDAQKWYKVVGRLEGAVKHMDETVGRLGRARAGAERRRRRG